MSGFFEERTREWQAEAVQMPDEQPALPRIALHWHARSGPDDIAGFLGVYPIARAYRDCRSGLWLWSASWLAGIGARGSAAGQDEAVAAAEDAVGGWAAMAGLTEMELTKA